MRSLLTEKEDFIKVPVCALALAFSLAVCPVRLVFTVCFYSLGTDAGAGGGGNAAIL